MVKQDRSKPLAQLKAAMLAAIIESSDDAIISKDLNGVITSWNSAAERIFGYTAEEALGQPVTMLIPPDRADEEPGILSRIRRGEKVDHYETVRRHKNGSLVRISLSVSPMIDEKGRIVGAAKIIRDISYRREAEADRSRLAAIVDSSDDAIVSKDLKGIIMSWNRGAEHLFGFSAAEAIGKPITMLIPDDRQAEEPEILRKIQKGEKVDHYETVRRRKDGSLLEISLSVSPIVDRNGQVIGASKIARDITERKKAERAARDAEIMRSVNEAQEAERNKIAREIHDQLGQRMTGLRFKIESLIESCDSDPVLNEKAAAVRQMASDLDRDLGFLSWELRPTELEYVGLEDALRSYVREWARQYGINAEFHANAAFAAETPDQSRTQAANLYRIVQEALNNVLKHSGAEAVSVIIQARRDELVLMIEDDGRGFDISQTPAASMRSGGQGLVGMRERAAMLGGRLEIESDAGKGTTILVRVPRQSAE